MSTALSGAAHALRKVRNPRAIPPFDDEFQWANFRRRPSRATQAFQATRGGFCPKGPETLPMRAVVAITPPRCTEPRLFWQASASSEEARQRRHLVLGTDLRQRPPQYLRRGGTVMNDDDATGAHALAEEGSGEGVEPSTVRRERFEQRVPATNAVCGTTNAWRVDGANGIAPFEHTASDRRQDESGRECGQPVAAAAPRHCPPLCPTS